MEWNGLNNELVLSSLVSGNKCKELERELYQTDTNQEIDKYIKFMSDSIEQAIKDNDHETLFALERQAITRDNERYGDEKKYNAQVRRMKQAEILMRATSTHKGALNYLQNERGELPNKIPPKDLFLSAISHQKAELTIAISKTVPTGWKEHFKQRQKGLSHLQTTYTQNLQKVLDKELAKDKGRGR